MEIKKKTIEDLKRIMKDDYGLILGDTEANEIGLSLLRLTRIAHKITTRGLKSANAGSAGRYSLRTVTNKEKRSRPASLRNNKTG